MNQLQAFRDTVSLAMHRKMPDRPGTSLGLQHLQSMLARVEVGGFSEAKLGRWLGRAQCAVVAAEIGITLDDMKAINLTHADGAR